MYAAVLAFVLLSGQGWQQPMLAMHNHLRSEHRLPPLHWSEDLTGKAARWASTLLETGQIRHDPSRHGQNLFAITQGNATAEFVFNAWASEASDYNYRSNTCSDTCGHYTQIVWRETTEVGCATARNANLEVWVCDYNPPGNVNGARPY